MECDDNNNCTTDMCMGNACTNTPCAAGDECNTLVDCDPATCAPTTVPVACDDSNLCTADSCVDGVGCVSTDIEIVCITTPCHAASCDPILGCVVTPLPDSDGDGTCDIFDVCTGDDATGDSDGDGICDDLDDCTATESSEGFARRASDLAMQPPHQTIHADGDADTALSGAEHIVAADVNE